MRTPAHKPKILCYLRDTRPLGGIIWAAEGDPGAMAVVEADGQLTATALYEGVGSEVEALREALTFYATEWHADIDAQGYPNAALFQDQGKRARAALAKVEAAS